MHGPSHRIEPKDRRIREGSTRLNQGVRPSRPTGPLSDVLALQRVLGNRAVSRLIENGLRAEDELVSAARPVVEGEGGWPLDFATRREMESKLGHDLGDVRIDTGAEAARSARELHGEAYAIGRHVVLGAGIPSLETPSGRAVLAHELVHVIQWRNSPISSQIIAPPTHPAEAEAHQGESFGLVGTSAKPGGFVQRLDTLIINQERWNVTSSTRVRRSSPDLSKGSSTVLGQNWQKSRRMNGRSSFANGPTQAI